MTWLTGYPREKIDWFPTIDPESCVKCVICMDYAKKELRDLAIIVLWDAQPASISFRDVPPPFQTFMGHIKYIKINEYLKWSGNDWLKKVS